jgi:hypothetical protein
MLRKTYNIISPERENVYQKVLVDWKTNVFFYSMAEVCVGTKALTKHKHV